MPRRRPPPALSGLAAMLALAVPAAGCRAKEAWFVDRAAALGAPFVFVSGAEGKMHLPEIMGAGVGLLDFDGDGDLDILLLNGGRLSDGMPVAGDDGAPGRLYRNDGDWRFADVTAAAGFGDTGYNMGLAIGDVDGDGDVDVYFANHGPNRLYVNQGDGTFADATRSAGIAVDGWSSSAAFFDYDRDGDLDLYVARYAEYNPEVRCSDRIGRADYCGPQNYRHPTDVLLRNDGRGRFTDVSRASGIAGKAMPGMGVVCEDFDEDGWLDVYVANDATANLLWRNRGDGTFEDIAMAMGAAFSHEGGPKAGMGVTAADLDGDGWVDVVVTNLKYETNSFFHNLGAMGGFAERSHLNGFGLPSAPFTGFGVLAADIELDGDRDVVAVNGDVRVIEVPGQPWPGFKEGDSIWERYSQTNSVYVNDGAGMFGAMGAAACGALCAEREVSRGLAKGDLDDDGDVDFVVANVESPARLYENRAPRAGRWLRLRLVDSPGGRDALGARVAVRAGGRRWVDGATAATGYMSSSDPRVHFGLGPVAAVDGVDVRWPTGEIETFAVACVDCDVALRRGEGTRADAMPAP